MSAQKRRRRRIWPWAVAIVAVVAIWLVNITWIVGGNQGHSDDGQELELSLPGFTTAVRQDAAKAAEYLAGQGKVIVNEAMERVLAHRAEEFAVDPNRNTEWNYEPNGRKVVYLTIDDGPSEMTQPVLDILDRYNCKATFFVTAIDPGHYDMIAEAYRRGHTIGLHTASHDYAQVYSSQSAYFADLDAIGKVVEEQIGYVPCFIRFPGGSSNGISANYSKGIMSALVNEVQARGYQYYDWNASSGDGSVHTADELVSYACDYDAENIILLCHDSATKQTTVDALPRIIEHYQALGYTFEAIDRSTMVPHHETSN